MVTVSLATLQYLQLFYLSILSMTFERFYSIIMPHKAASFNTVKWAKLTILIIVIFTVTYNIPHLFISSVHGRQCLPYGTAMGKPYGEFYYWLSFVISYALPFVLLLMMNCVIIRKIRNRSNFMITQSGNEGQGQSESKSKVTKMKTSDKQVYAILLLVTFGFLILTTPGYLLFLFIMVVDFRTSPRMFAGYYLFYNFAQKMHYTNHGINFFLYVISGQKFRTDILNLFRWNMKGGGSDSSVTNSMEIWFPKWLGNINKFSIKIILLFAILASFLIFWMVNFRNGWHHNEYLLSLNSERKHNCLVM